MVSENNPHLYTNIFRGSPGGWRLNIIIPIQKHAYIWAMIFLKQGVNFTDSLFNPVKLSSLDRQENNFYPPLVTLYWTA